MLLRKCLLLVAIVASLALSQAASAALLTFSNLADYQSQLTLSGIAETNFTNFDALVPMIPGSGSATGFTDNGINFVGSVATPLGVFSTATEGDFTNSGLNYLGYNIANSTDFFQGDTFTIVLPGGARAVRLNISSPNDVTNVDFATLTVGGTSTNTLAANSVPISGATRGYFLGIIDTTSSFQSADLSFAGLGLYRVDDVGFAAVPEPSSLALAAIAGLFGFTRRRRIH